MDPEEECSRCSRNVIQVHPDGWMILHVRALCMEDSVVLLCAECMADFGEWLVPELREVPEWISERDQLGAIVRDNLK
jgi:hypothetical protein